MGFSDVQRDWLLVQGAVVRKPAWPYQRKLALPEQLALERCKTPDYFPGHDLYLYIDADSWVQSCDAVEGFCAGAADYEFCVAPERHPSYALTHYWGIEFGKAWFGPLAPGTLEIPVNAGVFAGRADARHWQAWHRRIADVVEQPPMHRAAHFALDQAALNAVFDRDRLPCAYTLEKNNFLCNHGRPKISEDGTLLLDPYPPYQPLGIVHNAGNEKKRLEALQTPSGSFLTRGFTYVAPSVLPAGDYVSPGLTVIFLDQCFPNMAIGNIEAAPWPYVRRGIKHNWYCDKRDPLTGFINRDEAHISLQYCASLP